MVRSLSDERRIARTRDIGLRREPQPPMPMVMPSRSWATTSASVIRLSRISPVALLGEPGVALGDERVSCLVGHAREIELVGETLFVPVAPLHVDRIDSVERLLRGPDDGR